jgi:hypothetical protein
VRDSERRIARTDIDRVSGANIHRDRDRDRDCVADGNGGSERDAVPHSESDRCRGIPNGDRDEREPFSRLGNDVAGADRRR